MLEKNAKRGSQDHVCLETPNDEILPLRGCVRLKIGCHVLPWGMWVTKDTAYTWDGRKWMITLGEAMRQISALKYQGVDCSDGDLEPYFGAPNEFQQMLKRMNLEFAGVWSTILPKKLAALDRTFVNSSLPMSDPNQFRGLSISELTEDRIREDLSSKKALVGNLSSMGAQVLVTGGPFILREDIKEKHYRITGSYLNEIGEEARTHGMRLAHHPHLGTLFQGSEDVEMLLDHTDHKVVGICLDTAHLPAAGVDPVALVRKHSEKIAHAHIKDLREGKFVELGEGTVDLGSILKELKNHGYDRWLVAEVDIPNNSAYESSASNKRQLDRLVGTLT